MAQGTLVAASAADLHFYLSFRSPYTAIAVDRVKALADAWGARLQLRFVLPMVMRGLPVPRMKGLYFALDAAREARRYGVPFGRIADPLGAPVERGYSLLPWAREQGRGFEYCRAFLRAVWGEGVDAGGDAGLRRIVEAAGLDWRQAQPLIGNDGWRAEAEANRAEMFELGLWGVPCFRVDEVATWGQDRLWVIEDELRRVTGAASASGAHHRPRTER
jgi:2-hydroxychromene-2-carboxylate isomerase